MTLDREVRLSPEQIHYLDGAARRRINELGRTIARATAAARAGQTIQRGTLDRHQTELAALASARDSLRVAREQVQRQIRQSLGMEGR